MLFSAVAKCYQKTLIFFLLLGLVHLLLQAAATAAVENYIVLLDLQLYADNKAKKLLKNYGFESNDQILPKWYKM